MERRIMKWGEFYVAEAAAGDRKPGYVSRRDFLRRAGASAAATGIAAASGVGAYDIIGSIFSGEPEARRPRPRAEEVADEPVPDSESAFTYPDPSTQEGYDTYRAICDEYIATRKPNLLGITGDMLAEGARKAHAETGIIHPPELALAQLVWEGGIGNPDPESRTNRTNNPFNLGNDDEGNDRYFRTPKEGVDLYFKVMAKDYLRVRTPEELMQRGGFLNFEGLRYASATNYEKELKATARSIKRKISSRFIK